MPTLDDLATELKAGGSTPASPGGSALDALAHEIRPKTSALDSLASQLRPAPADPFNANVQMATALGRPAGVPLQQAAQNTAAAGAEISDAGTQAGQIPTQAKAEFAKTGAGLVDFGANAGPQLLPDPNEILSNPDTIARYQRLQNAPLPGETNPARELRGYAQAQEATLQPPQTATGTVINTVGSTGAKLVPPLVAGAVTGGAGAAVVGGAELAGDTYNTVYERRIQQGMTPQDAARSASLAGLGGGVIGTATGGLVGGAGGQVAKPLVRKLAGQALEGAAYGGIQSAGSEAITSAATGDPMQLGRVPEGAGVGAAINVGLSLLGAALTKGKAKLLPAYQQRMYAAKTPAEAQAVVDEARGILSLEDLAQQQQKPPDVFGGGKPPEGPLTGLTAPGPRKPPITLESLANELRPPAGTTEPGTTPQPQPPANAGPAEATPPVPPVFAPDPSQLPPLREGHVRLVHLGHVNEESLAKEGFRYHGSIDSNTRGYQDASKAEFGSDDPRFATARDAVVMDVPFDEYRKHQRVQTAPGVLSSKFVVGILRRPDTPPQSPPTGVSNEVRNDTGAANGPRQDAHGQEQQQAQAGPSQAGPAGEEAGRQGRAEGPAVGGTGQERQEVLTGGDDLLNKPPTWHPGMIDNPQAASAQSLQRAIGFQERYRQFMIRQAAEAGTPIDPELLRGIDGEIDWYKRLIVEKEAAGDSIYGKGNAPSGVYTPSPKLGAKENPDITTGTNPALAQRPGAATVGGDVVPQQPRDSGNAPQAPAPGGQPAQLAGEVAGRAGRPAPQGAGDAARTPSGAAAAEPAEVGRTGLLSDAPTYHPGMIDTAAPSPVRQDSTPAAKPPVELGARLERIKFLRHEYGLTFAEANAHQASEAKAGRHLPPEINRNEADDVKVWREWRENAGRVGENPQAASANDLHRAISYQQNHLIHMERQAAKEGVTLHPELVQGIENEIGWYKRLIVEKEAAGDSVYGKGQPPSGMFTASLPEQGAANSPDITTGTTGAGSRNRLPSPGTPAVGAEGSVPTAPPPVKRKPGRTPFSKAAIERKLIDMHEAQGGAYSAQDDTELERIGTGIKSATTFFQKLPGEVRAYIENNPAAKRLFTVTNDPKQAHGEDAMGGLGDKYWSLIDRVTGSYITGAKNALRKDSNPATKFWLAFHDTILPPKDRPSQVSVDPESFRAGQEFEVNGSHFDVIEHEDGYLLLKDGDDFPLTPVDALAGEKIPVDANTLTEAKEPEVPEGDPFAGVREESTAQGEISAQTVRKEAPTSDTGVFGQEIFRPATGSNQGGLFHEPVNVPRPPSEQVGSREANRPENTAEMFGARPPEPPKIEAPPAEGVINRPPPAPPREAVDSPPPSDQPTSARKAMMAEDRKAMGLDDLPEASRRSWEQDLDAARKQGIPARAMDIAREVTDTPRALSDIETAGIVEAAAKLKNQHAATMDEIGKLTDPLEIRLKSAEATRIQQDFDTLTTAAKLSGTEKGRALASQKLTLNQDYQLISVKNRAKAMKGAELSAAESAQLENLTVKLKEADARLASLEKQMAEQTAQHEKAIREFESKRSHARIKSESGKAETVPVRVNLAERIVKRMESEADKSRDALKELRGRMFSGVAPDPTVVYHLAKIAAAKIARGGYEFVKFSKEMIADFGEKIGPHLKESWEQATKLVRAASGRDRALEGIKAKASEGAEVGRHVQALARSFVADGIVEREPLIDAVHEEVQKVLPDFTRDQTMDAISGYGDYKQLSKDEISVKLRDLKGQMQNLGKLRDLEAKLPPRKTGVERRTPSAEERQLIRQVNDLRRQTGIQATDPATQLKSTLDGIKTRLTNEIADLDLQISTGKQTPHTKTPIPYDAEATKLKAARDAKKAQFDQIFGKPELTDEQRVKIATAAAEKSIAELERRIATGDIAPRKTESRTPETPELKLIRARRDALQGQLDEMRKAANPPKGAEQAKAEAIQKQIDALSKRIGEGDLSVRRGKPTVETEAVAKLRQQRDALSTRLQELRDAAVTPEQKIQQAKARVAEQIAELTGRIASGDYRRHTPAKPELPASKELERMEFVRDRLRKQIDRQINAMKPKSTLAKVGGLISEPFNAARSIMTSIDFSAVLRQGGFIALGHPVRAAKSLGPMFRAFGSEQYAYRVAKELTERPNAPLYAKSKLYFADRDGPLSAHEEGFMSRWAGHIPGVKASERAYNTFLNKLRADSFDAMTSSLARNGEPTLDESKAIANYINKATGRGGLGNMETAAVPLATAFFSPRYIASRVQLLAGEPFYGGSAATRKMIAGDYARFLLGLGVVYALGAAAGGTIEKDPRSSDFAKLKFGNTRLDPGTGLLQYITFASRMFSGETKSATSGRTSDIRGKLKYGQRDADKVISSFVRSKLAPLPSTAVNLFTGKDPVGQPVTLGSTMQGLVTPLGVSDIYRAMQDQGLEGGTIIGLLALFGMGTQTYKKNEPERRSPR